VGNGRPVPPSAGQRGAVEVPHAGGRLSGSDPLRQPEERPRLEPALGPKAADAPINQTADTQCFNYDYLRRLTQAWTPASADCTAAPAAAGLGSAAPYWQQWSYDATGNRLTQTEHATASGDVSTSYGYPAAGAAQAHTLLSSTVTGSTGSRTSSYGYDTAGNTLSRPGANGQQRLSWDAEGHLGSVSDASGTTSFVYDADGNRLIRRDHGATTLYSCGFRGLGRPPRGLLMHSRNPRC
jgi:YD repeat-containing protein